MINHNFNKKVNVLIVGGGFAGLNAAKILGNKNAIHVTLIDKKNYHLFQPLLYQVAMAGLSPADIATPIRYILRKYKNIDVIMDHVVSIDRSKSTVSTNETVYFFDYLILACGATHCYFGKSEWKNFAPGMKTIEQAIEIRRKVLSAFEFAQKEKNIEKQKKILTFVIIGGGATGVELAGSLADMKHFALKNLISEIQIKNVAIILIEAGNRILPSFSEEQSLKAKKYLEKIGVTILTDTRVTDINFDGVFTQHSFIPSITVIWAAGVQPSETGKMLNVHLDNIGRVKVNKYLQVEESLNIFVVGDQAHIIGKNNLPLPGLASVAIQEGRFAAQNILKIILGEQMLSFNYKDKGQMATIGRGKAIAEIFGYNLDGYFAWLLWAVVHITYLIGFKNKVVVITQWLWAFATYSRGAMLITNNKNNH